MYVLLSSSSNELVSLRSIDRRPSQAVKVAGPAAVRPESSNSLLEGANTATVIVWYQHACRQSGTYTNGGWRVGIYPRRTACTTQPCRAGTNEPFYFRRLRINLANGRACTDPPPFFTDFSLRFLLASVSRPLLGDVTKLKESASVGDGETNRRNFHRKAKGLNRMYVCIRSRETENRAWKLAAFGTSRHHSEPAKAHTLSRRGEPCRFRTSVHKDEISKRIGVSGNGTGEASRASKRLG